MSEGGASGRDGGGRELTHPLGTPTARSPVTVDGIDYGLLRRHDGGGLLLAVRGDGTGFEAVAASHDGVTPCALSSGNAARLRDRLRWLRPVPLGLATSFGFGDRLGLATPGHVRALRRVPGAEDRIAPVFAQQSVRENSRTGRTPQQVLDDATWGLFEEGWRRPWGADADHLKTPEDLEPFVEAGYTFFTIDPGDHVDNTADSATAAELEAKVAQLPWESLECTRGDLDRRYLTRAIDLDGSELVIERDQLMRAAAKYGGAVAHATRMYRQLLERLERHDFEFEVSVDETATPTTLVDHLFIAGELIRLGVRWVSLAPRFVGRFEKGVDYIGDVVRLAESLAGHAAVARTHGPYKLSLHSGSDKFSIYPIAANLTARGAGPLLHVKTAGTSYLEALRATARIDPALFRELLGFALERYDTDRASYHVSATPGLVPSPDRIANGDLTSLLEQFDARQVLHVTFGSALERFGERLRSTLERDPERYAEVLETHLERHLQPLLM
jgi:hypothetical protein